MKGLKMKTEQTKEAIDYFNSLSVESRGEKVAIAYTPAEVGMHFGSLGSPEMYLTDEQIAMLPIGKQEMFAKAKKEAEIKNCTLLAGENTDIVTTGTLYHCKQSLWMITQKKLPRDRFCGKGCWVIIDENQNELASGSFDKEMVW